MVCAGCSHAENLIKFATNLDRDLPGLSEFDAADQVGRLEQGTRAANNTNWGRLCGFMWLLGGYVSSLQAAVAAVKIPACYHSYDLQLQEAAILDLVLLPRMHCGCSDIDHLRCKLTAVCHRKMSWVQICWAASLTSAKPQESGRTGCRCQTSCRCFKRLRLRPVGKPSDLEEGAEVTALHVGLSHLHYFSLSALCTAQIMIADRTAEEVPGACFGMQDFCRQQVALHLVASSQG